MSSEFEHGERSAPVELNLASKRSSEAAIFWREPESLVKEWNSQARDLARRFAEKLGLSREEYMRTLPEFNPIPESFKDFEITAIAIIVDPRAAWFDLLGSDVDVAKSRRSGQVKSQQPEVDFENLRINPMFDVEDLKDWTEGDFQTPKEPYATWLTYVPNKSVEEVRSNLSKDQRGGTVFDGIALYLKRPQILNHCFLKFPGSQVDSEYAPFLSASPNREGRPNHPSLNRGSIDTKSPNSACLIASKIK